MITDHSSAIPGSADPGSTSGEAHNLTAPPTLTTALILDPTGPGYRLDSKSGGGVVRYGALMSSV